MRIHPWLRDWIRPWARTAARLCFRSCWRLYLRWCRELPGRVTARGGLAAVFGTCFIGLLIADWAGWEQLSFAVFFLASSLTAYYVRPGSLLPVAVSPPLLFFLAMTIEKALVASGALAALSGTVVTLAGASPWLLSGTALTLFIALLRGVTREVRALVLDLRSEA